IIARRGEGSVRDSLSLLDQVIAFSGKSITAADVATVLGLSDTAFFARVVSRISDGDHAGILEALQEAADNGRDFKMLFRDLLSFIRSLLLVAGGAPESLLAASPEDLVTIRDAAERFSYSDLLRIANLLIRDDETVNKAEHQRLAVEIALLKAATFPRLKAVEAVLAGDSAAAGGAVPARAPAPTQRERKPAGEGAGATPSTLDGLQQRIQKTKPLIASYLSHAKSAKKDGNRVTWTFDDATYADYVRDAKVTIEQIASDVFGEPVTIEAIAEVMPNNRREEDKPSALRDDPIVRAFQKHLGADIVEGRRTK
ncbi:MAG TPA: hypothetical protein VF381_03970, partial [Thermoanaerobaculia bacterium]